MTSCTRCGDTPQPGCQSCENERLRAENAALEAKVRKVSECLHRALEWAGFRPAGIRPNTLRWWLDARALLDPQAPAEGRQLEE